jgi:hypothetical protein
LALLWINNKAVSAPKVPESVPVPQYYCGVQGSELELLSEFVRASRGDIKGRHEGFNSNTLKGIGRTLTPAHPYNPTPNQTNAYNQFPCKNSNTTLGELISPSP